MVRIASGIMKVDGIGSISEYHNTNSNEPANTSSIRLRAVNTSFPIPKPNTLVTPGARNFRGASINEIPKTKPTQQKVIAVISQSMLEDTAYQVSGKYSLALVIGRCR